MRAWDWLNEVADEPRFTVGEYVAIVCFIIPGAAVVGAFLVLGAFGLL